MVASLSAPSADQDARRTNQTGGRLGERALERSGLNRLVCQSQSLSVWLPARPACAASIDRATMGYVDCLASNSHISQIVRRFPLRMPFRPRASVWPVQLPYAYLFYLLAELRTSCTDNTAAIPRAIGTWLRVPLPGRGCKPGHVRSSSAFSPSHRRWASEPKTGSEPGGETAGQ